MATEVPCSANSACAADGPVMTMMNKRLRALRKKYNRILQMEDRVAHGKPLNKEQEELLRSKLAVSVLIEEYEHLRQPVYDSLQEELSLAIAASKREAAKDVKEKEEEKRTEAEVVSNVKEEKEDGAVLSAVEDLLHLLYFGNLFDLKFLDSDFDMMLYTRTHERTSCISYDSVTDDTTRVLQEEDLDMISALRTLILSRPSSSDFSHKNALSDCIHHAKLWLQNSDQLILPGSSYSYAGLREHVNKILGSDYTTATPEVKPSVDLAAEVGYGNAQAQMNEMYESAPVGNAASHSEHYQHHYEADHSEIKGEISHSENLNSGEVTLSQHELEKLTIRDQGHNELQSHPGDSREFVPPRNYPNNYRANHRGGGGRRYGGGYSNGRGGRGGRGGFQNGEAEDLKAIAENSARDAAWWGEKFGNSKDIPEIPNHLSDEGKNFLMLCLQRDPSLRPSAVQLMDHPFVRDQAKIKISNGNIVRDAYPSNPSSSDGCCSTMTTNDFSYNRHPTNAYNRSTSPIQNREYLRKETAVGFFPVSRTPSDLSGLRSNMSLPVSPCSSPLRQFRSSNWSCLPSPPHPMGTSNYGLRNNLSYPLVNSNRYTHNLPEASVPNGHAIYGSPRR